MFTRSYISIIPLLVDWKRDALALYSDAHKDAYGCRWYPSHLLDAQYSMEDVMDAVTDIYAAASEEAIADLPVDEYNEAVDYTYSPTLFTNRITF